MLNGWSLFIITMRYNKNAFISYIIFMTKNTYSSEVLEFIMWSNGYQCGMRIPRPGSVGWITNAGQVAWLI